MTETAGLPAKTRGPTSLTLKKLQSLIFEMDVDNKWDAVQAKDVPAEILEFVRTEVERRRPVDEIRCALRIASPNATSWRKIVSAFQQGARASGGVSVAALIHKHWEIGGKLEELITDAIENGMPAFNDKGQIICDQEGRALRVLGITKELSQAIDAFGRNNERYVALALKAGLMKDTTAGKSGASGGGTTVLVQNLIPMPSAEDIRAREIEVEAKAKAIQHELPKT
jgi:hypothetical protein